MAAISANQSVTEWLSDILAALGGGGGGGATKVEGKVATGSPASGQNPVLIGAEDQAGNMRRLLVEDNLTPNLRVTLYGGTGKVTVTAPGDGQTLVHSALTTIADLRTYNGTTMDLVRSAEAANSAGTGAGILACGMMVRQGPTDYRAVLPVSQLSAGANGATIIPISDWLYNGTTYDPKRSATAAAGTIGTGLMGAGILGFDSTNYQRIACNTSGQMTVAMPGTNATGVDGVSNSATQFVSITGSQVAPWVLNFASNGATWDRVRTANGAAGTTGTGLLGVGIMGFDGTNYVRPTAATPNDATSPGTQLYVAAFNLLMNGTNHERQRSIVAAAGLTGVAAVASKFNFNRINTNATTTPKSSAGILHSITINTPGAAANTASVYDSTGAATTPIAIIDTTIAGAPTRIFDVAFANGLTIITATGTAADLTVAYV